MKLKPNKKKSGTFTTNKGMTKARAKMMIQLCKKKPNNPRLKQIKEYLEQWLEENK